MKPVCVLLVLCLSVILPALARHPTPFSHQVPVATSAEAAPTCKAIGAVCANARECCSGNCLLLVCALPINSKVDKLALPTGAMPTVTPDPKAVALEQAAPTCKAIGAVCANARDCCSGNCLLLVCALPINSKVDKRAFPTGALPTVTPDPKAVALEQAGPTCKVLGAVCSNARECCSGNCLLLVCGLSINSKVDKRASPAGAMPTVTPDAKAVALEQAGPTCKVIGAVCSNDRECCSGNCLLLVCALPLHSDVDTFALPIMAM